MKVYALKKLLALMSPLVFALMVLANSCSRNEGNAAGTGQGKPTKKQNSSAEQQPSAADVSQKPNKNSREEVQDSTDDLPEQSQTESTLSTSPEGINNQTNYPDYQNRNFSLGNGGIRGQISEVQYNFNGQTSSYRINAPNDNSAQRPHGLHVHLHGDGGGGYRDFPNREARYDLIGVTVKSPGSWQWGRTRGVAHAQYLNALIQNELLRKYNIDLTRIYFSGVSGGAFFLTGHFIPMYGRLYNSGALILCGGESPQVRFQSQQFLTRFKMLWLFTQNERPDIMTSVRDSINAYRNALNQFSATNPNIQINETYGQGDHCEFDNRGYATGIQMAIDQRFRDILQNQLVQ